MALINPDYTVLMIAGHGKQPNGGFAPGATGLIEKGEHRFMTENLFPELKKYVPKGYKVVWHTAYDVFARGNIVELAKSHGPNTIVIEWHYDAAGSSASGGHVIIHKTFSPDKIDEALVRAIGKTTGVSKSYPGGFSKRNNLANLNRTAKAGVNYRLVEVGFGTNSKDANYMLNNTAEMARIYMQELFGDVGSVKPSEPAKTEPTPVKQPAKKPAKKEYTGNSIVEYLNHNKIDSDFSNRKILAEKHNIKNYTGTASQNLALLNAMKGKKPVSSTPKKKSIAQMAQEVIDKKHGNGHEDRRKSLGISQAEYEKVRAEVNRRQGVKITRSIEDMAREVINNPKVPKGHSARQKYFGLDNATYQKVRARVNQLS